MRASILGWTILLAALALLLGLGNLFQVHLNKIKQGQKGVYSLVLIGAMLVTFVITLIQGRQGLLADWLFSYVQLPLESSLMAVLAVSLTLAAARLIQSSNDTTSIIFVTAVVLVLLGSAPIFGFDLPFFSQRVNPFISRVLALGGMRGLLIGVGLGTLATGIRILLGSDRPFGG